LEKELDEIKERIFGQGRYFRDHHFMTGWNNFTEIEPAAFRIFQKLLDV
jgi:hypothetical protein